MIELRRAVRFEEVDAAGLLFFAHFAAYAHEAMERLFDSVDGGYVALITKRRIGFPAVTMSAEFTAPLRYGDIAVVRASVVRLGTKSVQLGYHFERASDGASCAQLTHTVVATDLDALKSCAMPPDVRAALEGHLERH
jgi:4-hydroxybenzoyl-CoA thioesterase